MRVRGKGKEWPPKYGTQTDTHRLTNQLHWLGLERSTIHDSILNKSNVLNADNK